MVTTVDDLVFRGHFLFLVSLGGLGNGLNCRHASVSPTRCYISVVVVFMWFRNGASNVMRTFEIGFSFSTAVRLHAIKMNFYRYKMN